jgi:Brp/Blh family beta-carotene 15,15'-monooxygenase
MLQWAKWNPRGLVLVPIALGFGVLTTQLPGDLQLWIFFAAVMVLGLPHGAFDGVIARRVLESDRVHFRFPIVPAYLILGACAAFFWILFPTFALVMFLLISAWHFGDDFDASSKVERLNAGLLLLTAPVITQGSEVASIYQMLGANSAGWLVNIQAFASVAILCAVLLLHESRRTQMLIMLSVMLATAYLLGPLVYFLIYFCFFHSPMHTLRVLDAFTFARGDTLEVCVFALGAMLVVSGVVLFTYTSGMPLEESMLRTIFIGLAALTVPHMLIVESLNGLTDDER